MKALLRGVESPDVPVLQSFVPEDPENFGFLLDAYFGPEDGPGEESFDIVVCTPGWLESEVKRQGGILVGRHYLVVTEYNLDGIKKFLENYAQSCEGRNWQEIAEKLGRLGKWEFEDYRE